MKIKLLKVSFPVLVLLVTVLPITGRQQLIARADTCSASICLIRAGYVAHGNPGTYNYVATTFTIPRSLGLPNGNPSSVTNKFSIGVNLGGDDQFGEPNWAAAGVDIQVTGGRITSETSFWSLPNGASSDPRGPGGYFPTNVTGIQLGDTIFASIGLNSSSSQVSFYMRDNRSGLSDQFTPEIDDSSKLPEGQTAGCVLFFNVWAGIAYPFPLAYPKQAKFSDCRVGSDSTGNGTQAIDQTNPFPYTANGLSRAAILNPSGNGNFTVKWNRSTATEGSNNGSACTDSICQLRAGYVANSTANNTYDYVESTFRLPTTIIPNSSPGNTFSIGVGLGGDNHFSSQNWAASGINIQVGANGQAVSEQSFWSVTDGATNDSRGEGPGHGYFPTNVKNIQLGDKIRTSVEFDPSTSQITFFLQDLTQPSDNTNPDQFTLPITSGQPDGKTAGCFLFFNVWTGIAYPFPLAHPDQVKFSDCRVGSSNGNLTIGQTNPFPYIANGLSETPSLSSIKKNGNFSVSWK